MMYTEPLMSSRVGRFARRLARGAAGCLLGGAMMVPLGPTTTSQAVNQMNATSMRGVPSVAARPVVRDTMIWVPGRPVLLPGEGTVMVPGHWERRLDGGDVHVPPLTVRNPATGETTTLPAGVRPPVEERSGP
jgi:hypothetical protein